MRGTGLAKQGGGCIVELVMTVGDCCLIPWDHQERRMMCLRTLSASSDQLFSKNHPMEVFNFSCVLGFCICKCWVGLGLTNGLVHFYSKADPWMEDGH